MVVVVVVVVIGVIIAIAFYDYLMSYFLTKMNHGDFCLGLNKDFIIRIIHDFELKQKLVTVTEVMKCTSNTY